MYFGSRIALDHKIKHKITSKSYCLQSLLQIDFSLHNRLKDCSFSQMENRLGNCLEIRILGNYCSHMLNLLGTFWYMFFQTCYRIICQQDTLSNSLGILYTFRFQHLTPNHLLCSFRYLNSIIRCQYI